VALALHRGSRAVVWQSLIPIALGHALAIALVATAVIAVGIVVNGGVLRGLAGVVLILWALYHALYGARHRARVGLRAGFAGLLLWSFLMAGAHGAGLMVVPALMPLCLGPDADIAAGPLAVSVLAVAVHPAAMLAVPATIAVLGCVWVGGAFLRCARFRLD